MKHFKPLLAALLLAVLLPGCAVAQAQQPQDGRLRIVASLFPQYDFARQIAGDYAQVELLLPPGVESHSFEPTPADMIRIHQADLFLYTGRYMEPWAQQIIDGLEGDTQVVDVSEGIQLDQEDHSHGEHGHEDHDHGGFDPHIWTSPVNAKQMVENIVQALMEADPAHAQAYRANADTYQAQLDSLDAQFREIVANGNRREIVFGGRFALHYFAKEYGLSYLAAFDSCSHESEPSARTVARIVDEVESKGIPVIYYEELVDPKVARVLAEETGAVPLLLHSCHNLSRDELEAGETYLTLMEQNAQNLKEGLN